MLRALTGTLGPLGVAAGRVPWYRAGGAPQPVAAYQPKGAASYAASLVNLANPGTYDATEGVAPSWAAGTGWSFDGASQYLKTGVTPNEAYSVLVQFSGVTNNGYILGEYSPSTGAILGIVPNRPTNTVRYAKTGASPIDVAPALIGGNLGIAYRSGYRNGVLDSSALAAWTANDPIEMFVGALNRAAGYLYCACTVQAFVAYVSTLSAAQMFAVSAAMAAL